MSKIQLKKKLEWKTNESILCRPASENVDAYNQREGSQRQLARRFRVSLTFIENLLKRYRTDGTVEPRRHGGGQVAKLNREQEAVVATLVEENNDAIKARAMRATGATY